ncbi:Potential acrAB operon repressor [uncultured Clostridium sp.]|nr:Potential acrAB operon repressor [uncultured Clostridium sp.]
MSKTTKEDILIVALHLFARDGYEAVSVSQIAGELGMTKGALYRHYESKRDIFEHIVKRMEQGDGEQAEEYDMPADKKENETSVYKGYKQDKIEMRGDRAEMSDFPLYLNTVAGGLDRRDQTIGGFSFVVKIYALPVVEIIGQLLYLLGRYGFNAQFSDCL